MPRGTSIGNQTTPSRTRRVAGAIGRGTKYVAGKVRTGAQLAGFGVYAAAQIPLAIAATPVYAGYKVGQVGHAIKKKISNALKRRSALQKSIKQAQQMA